MQPTAPRNTPNSRLWSVYQYGTMVLGLSSFALVCLGSVPLFSLLYLLLPRARHKRAARGVISRAFRFYLLILRWTCATRCDTWELDALGEDVPLIVIANHPSLLDAVILLSRLPNAACIMKAGLLNNPLFGIAARMAGYASNASASEMIASSCDVLADGAQLVVFPEGGRSREFPVSPFGSACTLLARATKTPIQTVFLDYSSPYLGKHWGLFSPPQLPLHIQARVGKRIAPGELRPSTLRELETYFRAGVTLRS